MNKKGFVMLYIAVFSLFIAIAIFYGGLGQQNPGPDSLYLGENQIELIQTYIEGEQNIYFFELAATLAAKKAKESDNFESEFREEFDQYVSLKGFTSKDFEISFIPTGEAMQVVGIGNKEVVLEKEEYSYSIVPSFSIEVEYSSIKESIFV